MRRGRSERAGDLKAGNITPPLDWMTMSIRLMLPHAVHGLGFPWNVLEFVDLLQCGRKQEASLASGTSLTDRIEVNLHLLEFDTGVGELAIEVVVSVDLAGESPVIMVDEGIMEQGKVD